MKKIVFSFLLFCGCADDNERLSKWLTEAKKPIYKLSESENMLGDVKVCLMDSTGKTECFDVHGVWLPDTINNLTP